jgi:tetratricopeptide (TPR) repeat protein
MNHILKLIFFLMISYSGVFAQSDKAIFKKAADLFSEGKYQSTIRELETIESTSSITDNETLGLISYWKGISHNRLQNFPEAINYFGLALSYKYVPADLHYEYGQALYACEKLSEARLQFRESLRRKFKRGVSLYYIAYISKELGERKKAHKFFKGIDKLDPDEAQEVKQASEMQIGDIYLEQVESRSDSHKTIETYVIPQYQKALMVDPDSQLARHIHEKIINLQRKYDLVLFKLRNGRPTLNPPYFLRLAQEFGLDTNVTFSPAETTISKSNQSSTYARTDFIGRYVFYYRDILSVSPELRFNQTYYFNRVPDIYRNDNFLLAPALRAAYEHSLWDRPASYLMDYDFADARRDVRAEKEYRFNSRSHSFMIGERFNYFENSESIVRFRYRLLDSYLNDSDSVITSFVYEQLKSISYYTVLFYSSLDFMRVKKNVFNTNSLTLRGDVLLPNLGNWFAPSAGLGLTVTDPINDRSNRGVEVLINPGARLSRTFGKHWRINLKYDFQKNISKDIDDFAYTKSLYAFEVEYLF